MRKNWKTITTIVAIICTILLIISFILLKSSSAELGGSDQNNKPIVDNKLDMVYQLEADATDYQKEVFKELNDAVKKGDHMEIAGLVAKSFVTDFYTWSNKNGNFDVGGLDFIYGPYHNDVSTLARDTFYSDLNLFIDEFGRDNLMQVDNVEVTSTYASPLEIDGEELTTYYVEARWTYNSDTKMDISKLQNKAYYNVVYNPNSKRLEIAYSLPIDWE